MPRLPNFIVILNDDLGYNDLGCFGAPLIRTPRIDRLAETGMRLTSFYGQPVCGPSRAAFMTGCYPLRVAERGNYKHNHPVLHEREITLAEHLKGLGYATSMIGKWDLAGHTHGVDERLQLDLLPHRRGFDEHFGTPDSNDHWSSVDLLENGEILESPIRLERSTTERYADRALSFIQRHADEPFFLYLAPNMPHTQLHVSPEFEGRSPAGPFGDAVEEIDHHVGRIIDELVRRDLAGDTYVFFTSDHGPWLCRGPHGGSARPLRSGKVSTWEGGPRVPCVAWAPGRIPENAVCDEVLSNMDLFPTFAELTGSEPPSDRVIDGRSIAALLAGRPDDAGAERTYFYYLRQHLQAVRQGRWKLHLPRPAPQPWNGNWSPNTHIAPWDDIAIDEPLLFDLEADVSESRDVAAANPDVVERLNRAAASARADVGDYDRIGAGARFYDEGPQRPESAPWLT